jgi:glycosyltransferase involved in cell wall biosynthesis
MTKILIISCDTVNVNMGGVGVRNWELARALSRYFVVTLAIPNPAELESQNFRLFSFDLEKGNLRDLAAGMDVIVLHGFVLHFHPYLRELGIPLAVDLYVPSLFESLVWHDRDDWEAWIPAYEEYARVQAELIRAGDFFFCASERQRDYWLGWLHSQKRINPHTYRQDPSLRKLLDVVPFGIPDGKPKASKPVLKGVNPGISPEDKLIIWSGGLWDWLDPLTLIQAMARLELKHPELKLYFLGTRHPNPVVSGMRMPDRAIQLSQEMGLYNQSVFFGDWAPYDQRERYLAEADLAVMSHLAHIETHFSFRTRVLDCIWASIPLIITEGDAMAELVKTEQLGYTVPPGDAEAMAEAIEKLLTELDSSQFSTAFDRIRQQFTWERVTQPLKDYCETPALTPDKGKYLTDAERIARDKDVFLQQVIHDKDEFYEAIVRDREAVIDRYQRSLPFRVYHVFKRIIGKKA